MKTCANCGTSNRDTARFCANCGNNVFVSAPAAGLTGMLSHNSIIGNRYVIVQKIGQGGMAAVYQATDMRVPGTVWAIKEMSSAAIADPNDRALAVQWFQQEADLLRGLSHANLPRVIDNFADGGKHYLVMEYVPGQTLEQMLTARGRPFTEAEVIPWALQLCDVLSYLHSRQIIFRDLKPGNVMVMTGGQAKLIDFGIVRFFKPGKQRDTQALGTPGYSAPEAHTGQTDAQSDIYSLCVTLHQLLTGHDPAVTPFNIPPARQINPAVSPRMEQILSIGLNLQREGRWPNASVLRAEFAQLAGAAAPGRTPAGGPTVVFPKSSRPTRRLIEAAAQLSTGQLAAAAGGAVLALVVATWILAPAINAIRIDWNVAPIMALFGALGYAALPKRGSVFVAHAVLTTALALTVNARIGWPWQYTGADLFWATLISGGVMELWVSFINRVKVGSGDAAWKREAAWLAGMAVLGTILFYGILLDWLYLFTLLQPLLAAALGAGGWFLGDLVQQYLLFRQTGFRRLPS